MFEKASSRCPLANVINFWKPSMAGMRQMTISTSIHRKPKIWGGLHSLNKNYPLKKNRFWRSKCVSIIDKTVLKCLVLKLSLPTHIFGILYINLKIARSSIFEFFELWNIMTIFILAIHYSLRYLYTKYQWYNSILRYLNLFLQFVSFWTNCTVGYPEILQKCPMR